MKQRKDDDWSVAVLATLTGIWRWKLELAITAILTFIALAFIDEPMAIQLFAVACVAAIGWFTRPLLGPMLHL